MANAYTNGMHNVRAYGAVGDGVTDDSAAFQAAHDAAYDALVTAGDTLGGGAVFIPSGSYKLDSGLDWRPFVKMHLGGHVHFDFTDLSTSGVAFTLSNADGPTLSSGKNAANIGEFITGGSIYLEGPGVGGTSIGVKFGNFSDLADVRAFRDVLLANMVISSFYQLVSHGNYDTFFAGMHNIRLETGGAACIIAPTATNGNSGEAVNYTRMVMAQAPLGVDLTTIGLDFAFHQSSFDFLDESALRINSGAGYSNIRFRDCHFESCNDTAIVDCNLASYNHMSVLIDGVKLIPTNNSSAIDRAIEGESLPRTELFQGKFDLYLGNMHIAGYSQPSHAANYGMFMCNADVRVHKFGTVYFTDYKQILSRALILNNNWNFTTGTAGTVLDLSEIDGWLFVNWDAKISADLSTTQTFDGAVNSLRLTNAASGTTASYYSLTSDAFPVKPAQKLNCSTAIYGGTSTGDLRVQSLLRYYRRGKVKAQTVSSITRSGSTATVTTAAAHGLSIGHVVTISGCGEAGYNRKVYVKAVPTSTTFTFTVGASTTTPATGTPVYDVEDLVPLSATSSSGSDFGTATVYGDTGDPSYTGDRLWWAKEPTISDRIVPAGAAFARMELTISKLGASEVMYLGAALTADA